ncbi:MAG: helix-turn-helix domain-containing protein [Acidimicrobiia bacterium]|nr:helix-turn-helix domain-containing protein [Acidimicrobiia bacterium]
MDLETLKALGDETRYAIYSELAESTGPLPAQELAERLSLHANTVRLHLERLREVGIVEVEAMHHGRVGRPQHRYSLAPGAPGLGFDPPAHALLAGLLAALAENAGAGPDAARAVGREWGRQAAKRSRPRRRDRGAGSLDELIEQSDRLGFEPAADEPPVSEPVRVDFLHCPFRELAEAYPDLVCSLHRGLCEGILEGSGGATVEAFSSLYDPEPCHVVVGGPVS